MNTKATAGFIVATIATVAIGLSPMVHADVVQQVLVKVNGEIFTKTDLEQRQIAALRQLGEDQKADPSDAALRKLLNDATPQLLVSIVDEILIVQRGHELGYRMADDQFTGIVDNIKKENKLENEEQFQAALKQEGMTMADLRKSLERQMIVSRVQQNEVIGRIGVNDDEAREYYAAHISEFTSAQSITLREVFVNIPGGTSATVADDTAAHAKADAIHTRAVSGESFEKLAADLSDSPSRANAGLVGPLSMNDISADLKTQIETMKVGDITEVLHGPRGYQVLKLESKTTAETKPFEQAREDISNRVFTTKRQSEFQKYMEKLRAEAIIEWKNADLKTAYDLGIQQAKALATPRPVAPK